MTGLCALGFVRLGQTPRLRDSLLGKNLSYPDRLKPRPQKATSFSSPFKRQNQDRKSVV